MPSVDVKNLEGETVGTLELDARIFGIEPNRAVLHQAVVTQLANQRRGTHDTKTRGEVAGGGRKPWRQKGTGRARQGSTRAPHWRGGGVVFGPHPRSYHHDLPRKMRRLAMRSALSAKVAELSVTIVENLTLESRKTRDMVGLLAKLGLRKGALIVLPKREEMVMTATANVPRVRAVTPPGLNLLDVINYPTLVLTRESVAVLTKALLAEPADAAGAAEDARC